MFFSWQWQRPKKASYWPKQIRVKGLSTRTPYLKALQLHGKDIDVYVVVQSLSCVQLFVTLWTAARQPSLFFIIFWSLLKLMFIESLMPSNHLILWCLCVLTLPSIFPSIKVFSNSWLFASGDLSTGASISASVLPMNIQGWFPLGLTGLISLLSKGLFSSTTVWKYKFFGAQPSLWSNSHIRTFNTGKYQSFDFTDLCQQSNVSTF